MILWIITLLIILTVVSLLLINNRVLRYILGAISIVLLLDSVLLLSANMHSHYGMKKVTTEQQTQIYSAAPANVPVGMLITKKIANNHYVMIYKDAKNDKQPVAHFVPNKKEMLDSLKKTATYKKANVSTAQVISKTTKWQYKSDLMEWLFKFKDDNNLVKVERVVQVPLNWQVINK